VVASYHPTGSRTHTTEYMIRAQRFGYSIASNIFNHREKIGGKFTTLYQLMDIKGIKENKFKKISKYLFIDEELPPFDNEPTPSISLPLIKRINSLSK
jgi:hypothetical protein